MKSDSDRVSYQEPRLSEGVVRHTPLGGEETRLLSRDRHMRTGTKDQFSYQSLLAISKPGSNPHLTKK